MIEIRDRILDALMNLTLREKIEVLANVFICLGAHCLPQDELSHEELMKIIIKSRKENSETIGVALAEQGLYLLTWLNGEK